MRIEEYLQRVKLGALPAASAEGLHALHAAQAFSIPFENLTVFLGERPSLKPEDLFQKLVRAPRGGYCFELNGLFSWVLQQAGFEHQVHLARVQAHNPEPGPLTHQVIVAHAEGREWLCDVGFGGPSVRYPMPFELDRVETQDGEEFRLRRDNHFGFAFEKRQPEGGWSPQYFFQRNKIMPIDITMANHFTSAWELSIFRKTLLIARPFPGGKVTLFGRELKTRKGAAEEASSISGAEALLVALKEQIGVTLRPEQEMRLKQEFPRLMEQRA